MLKVILSLAFVGACLAGGPIEVNPDKPDGSGVDLSGTDLTNQFCALEGKRCKGTVLLTKTVPTVSNCLGQCSKNLQCLSAFYGNDKKCILMSSRCSTGDLKSGSGTDLYRLKKKEECPADRPVYSGPNVNYSNKYCKLAGKKCVGRDLYEKPRKLAPFIECLKKCSKLSTCGMVDFDGTNCMPKELACSDSELVADSAITNYQRLDAGANSCTGERTDAIEGGTQVVVPAAPVYCVRNNLNCFGRDIQFIPFVFSMRQCQDYCTANDDCKSVWWSWTGACWLKRHACSNNELIASWGHDSVQMPAGSNCAAYQPHNTQKYCVRHNRNCVGWFIDIRTYLFVHDLERCKYYCSYHSSCKSVYYDKLIDTCWLKKKKCEAGLFGGLTLTLTGDDAYKC